MFGKVSISLVALLLVTGILHASNTANIQFEFTKDATHWYLYGFVSFGDCDGIANFSLDVVSGPGTVITSSRVAAPRYVDESFNYVGFADWRNNGLYGIGLSAAQPTSYDSARVIKGIGQTAGTGTYGISWGAHCLLATGTYVGAGDFGVSEVQGQELPPDWMGPGNTVPFWAGPIEGYPWAGTSGPYKAGAGQSVTFAGNGGYYAEATYAFRWDFDNGKFVLGKTWDGSYDYLTNTLGLSPSRHPVTFTCKDWTGCVCSTTTYIDIVPEPASISLLGLGGLGLLRRHRDQETG